LQLAPTGDSKKVLSVFEKISSPEALWQFQLEKEGNNKGLNIALKDDQSQLFFDDGGNVGIQTKNPTYTFEVNGTVGAKSRVGTFQKGEVYADGNWHCILTTDDLKDFGTYEINARVKKAHRAEESAPAAACLYAIATHVYHKGNIKKVRSQLGFPAFFHRLCLRWKKKKNSCELQIKTGWNYGLDEQEHFYPIQYHITKLWE